MSEAERARAIELAGPTPEECARAEDTLTLISSELGSFKAGINMLAVNEQVRRVVQYVLSHNHDLLVNRNVDQIVLAAVYGVCKIHSTDVTFKDLVQAYKTLPSANSSTWLSVPLAKPNTTGNIIAFYNDVFVPRCKDYLHGMKDGTSVTISPTNGGSRGSPEGGAPSSGAAGGVGSAADGAGGQAGGKGALTGGSNATLTGSPNGFRAVKRARVAGSGDSKGGVAAGADSEGGNRASGNGEEEGGGTPASGGEHGQMGPPLSPTRKPTTHVPRSPYAEYPASPFKRPVASPLRLAAASPHRAAVAPSPLRAMPQGSMDHHRSPQRMPSKYGQVNLSPARPTSKSPGQREPHTPRTSFLHSFGTLGAPSPVPKFDEINGKLKSPAGANGGTGARSPAPRRLSTQPLDFDKRRSGPSGAAFGGAAGCAGANASHHQNGCAAQLPRATLSANSALLALANASGYRASSPARPSERAPIAGAPVPDSHRMQDLAVASVLLSADDGQ